MFPPQERSLSRGSADGRLPRSAEPELLGNLDDVVARGLRLRMGDFQRSLLLAQPHVSPPAPDGRGYRNRKQRNTKCNVHRFKSPFSKQSEPGNLENRGLGRSLAASPRSLVCGSGFMMPSTEPREYPTAPCPCNTFASRALPGNIILRPLLHQTPPAHLEWTHVDRVR